MSADMEGARILHVVEPADRRAPPVAMHLPPAVQERSAQIAGDGLHYGMCFAISS